MNCELTYKNHFFDKESEKKMIELDKTHFGFRETMYKISKCFKLLECSRIDGSSD